MIKYLPVVFCLSLFIVSCSGNKDSGLKEAVTAPLGDLNLMNAEIPEKLLEALRQPYKVPENYTCISLNADIAEFDELLGADVDSVRQADDSSLIETGTGKVKGAALGEIQGATTSIVPYRGWVRKLSGAERHSKKVNSAIAAGSVRRAFLKGLRHPLVCEQGKVVTD